MLTGRNLQILSYFILISLFIFCFSLSFSLAYFFFVFMLLLVFLVALSYLLILLQNYIPRLLMCVNRIMAIKSRAQLLCYLVGVDFHFYHNYLWLDVRSIHQI
jgi:hypothetical protein